MGCLKAIGIIIALPLILLLWFILDVIEHIMYVPAMVFRAYLERRSRGYWARQGSPDTGQAAADGLME